MYRAHCAVVLAPAECIANGLARLTVSVVEKCCGFHADGMFDARKRMVHAGELRKTF